MSDIEAILTGAGVDPGVAAALAAALASTVAEQLTSALSDRGRIDGVGAAPDPLQTMMIFGDRSRLRIHPTAKVNNALFNLMSGDVTIGEYSFFGHNVSVLTGTHDINVFGRDRQDATPPTGRDVTIGRGVWVASNATVVGPCRIGDNAVVGVGSLVLDDVAAYNVVAGQPAKIIRVIEHDPGADET